jgi:hypothetical protein
LHAESVMCRKSRRHLPTVTLPVGGALPGIAQIRAPECTSRQFWEGPRGARVDAMKPDADQRKKPPANVSLHPRTMAIRGALG